MRKLFYSFIFLAIIASCKKNDVANMDDNSNQEDKPIGILDTFLTKCPWIVVQKVAFSYIGYDEYPTDRGYIFETESDIKIVGIGGRIALTGKYKVELFQLPSTNWAITPKIDTLIVDSVQITDVNKFQYKTLENPIILNANKRYLICYFNKNHDSVYDAGLGSYQSDKQNNLLFPLKIGIFTIEGSYYTYHSRLNPEFLITEGEFCAGIIRGLVDFKYLLIK